MQVKTPEKMSTEWSSWTNLSTIQKIALGLGIPASLTVGYILYRRYRESREERPTFVGEDDIEVEMRVPQEAVKLIIGRQGANIKQLRKQTGARIDVDTEDVGEERVLLISGFPVQVCKAKAAIHQILTENTPVYEQLSVPQRSVGRIIGRGGETIRAICKSSGAKVTCDKESEGTLLLTRLIKLSGTQKEVAAAKHLILEKVSEDEELRKRIAHSAESRVQRKQPISIKREEVAGPGAAGEPACPKNMSTSEKPAPTLAAAPSRGGGDTAAPRPERLEHPHEKMLSDRSCQEDVGARASPGMPKFEIPSPDFSFHADEYLEVYVSASENPNHFWIQIIGSRSLQLDKLVNEMTQYYENSQSPEDLTVHVGDIVAAPLPTDGPWYRARVLGTLENGNLDLYFVDFGDNGESPLKDLRAIRSDFLSLPFQAIECSLARIVPSGEQWEEEALDEFDRLTHCAEWKPLVAKISSYVQTGISTWPEIHLYDTSNGQNLDIGLELVRQGYALELPQDVGEGDAAVPEMLQDILATETDASLDSLLSEAKKSPGETPHTLSCLSLSGSGKMWHGSLWLDRKSNSTEDTPTFPPLWAANWSAVNQIWLLLLAE
ncbi:tudor and KH domain-containing protein-like isoform X1 [Vombatus ursinus]|uniref:Tudor and KH domain-containing protein n=1 Tax=Vombatus ursinus TaxID=29139 RepID=A0A4X2L8L1_VOMUR|nr:tudor and KH domain-containing protein-like isoform X1 [Vombatus ursinus]XP_027717279.1 tudor and KH domain-containing protein-like isoform X1 [Vombatus ursinus]XP_027717280.1 tudor and KH domain-containing protein-like isoform X1 [Vombatus ursinus]XP_027717281.1 tudor and KH domain-containing protein-like isoform X1 [Vombatus ursinus]XP_027717282.1 tudor and KH domain-containing protein-like isoform X1 [Vombatus ursinus]XP_027717284.1 tudor and KH domain-containing protein-like isoform X1 